MTAGRVRIAAAAAVLLPAAAHAHLVSTRFGDYYSGLLHPVTSLENLLPWLALGLLAGLQQRETARWLLLAFPAAILPGVALGTLLSNPPLVSGVNLGSFVLLGVLVTLALKLPLRLLVGLGALFGFTHGLENGTAMLPGGNALLYVLGVTTAGYVTIALVTALAWAVAHRFGWGSIAVRAAGSWITAVGVLMVGLTLAGA